MHAELGVGDGKNSKRKWGRETAKGRWRVRMRDDAPLQGPHDRGDEPLIVLSGEITATEGDEGVGGRRQ